MEVGRSFSRSLQIGSKSIYRVEAEKFFSLDNALLMTLIHLSGCWSCTLLVNPSSLVVNFYNILLVILVSLTTIYKLLFIAHRSLLTALKIALPNNVMASLRHIIPGLTSKTSWRIVRKPIGMPWELSTGPKIQRFSSMGVKELATVIGPSLWRNTIIYKHDLQDQHKRLFLQYCDASSMLEAETR
jgi:hypothetical protein